MSAASLVITRDEFRHALADNYMMLARAVVALAVVDLVALRHRKTMRAHLWRWYMFEHNKPKVSHKEFSRWCNQQESAVKSFLSEGGRDVAVMADCLHYVRLAETSRLPYRRLRNAMQRNRRRCS